MEKQNSDSTSISISLFIYSPNTYDKKALHSTEKIKTPAFYSVLASKFFVITKYS